MESGEGVVQSRGNSVITSQPIDHRENSTQDPAHSSNNHVDGPANGDAPANGDEEDIEGEEDECYGEESIVEYFTTLKDMIIAKHEAPRPGRIPGLKYGNTLFDHQKHAVGAALRSLAGPLKGMILGDILARSPIELAMTTLSWEPGDGPSLIVAPLSCCSQFQDAIEDYSAELAFLFLKRPKLVLLSGCLKSEPWKPIGKCMILDEAHIIKNRNTRIFAAIVGNSKVV
ncbi:global transactivator [Fusarium napiforme]|uniref:Global transactivator n=1 Tax=Fusarium napiforme TaxID=42672 RepID=A0A8H5MR19_9HYPO|nr:global transactivator [Fusarium napiforme]